MTGAGVAFFTHPRNCGTNSNSWCTIYAFTCYAVSASCVGDFVTCGGPKTRFLDREGLGPVGAVNKWADPCFPKGMCVRLQVAGSTKASVDMRRWSAGGGSRQAVGGPERASGESRAAWARRQRCRQEKARMQGQTSRKVTDVLRKLGILCIPGASPSHHRSMQMRVVLSRLRGQ